MYFNGSQEGQLSVSQKSNYNQEYDVLKYEAIS